MIRPILCLKVVKEEGKLIGLRLDDIMRTWTKQMGHPVVTIRRVDSQTIVLTQNHFLLDPSSPPTVQSSYKYKA